jgi:hypothetical protein
MHLTTEYPSNMRLPHLSHPSGLPAEICRTYDRHGDVVFVLPGGRQVKRQSSASTMAGAMFRAAGWIDARSA